MEKLEEGFYVAHLRDQVDLFCYVHETEDGFSATMPNGEEQPVLSHGGSYIEQPYILPTNLEKTEPDKHLEQALNTIKFIYTNIGRLHEKQHKLEDSIKTGTS